MVRKTEPRSEVFASERRRWLIRRFVDLAVPMSFVAFPVSAAGLTQASQESGGIRYLIIVSAGDTPVEVRINDIPVGVFAAGDAETPAEVPLNEFLIAGTNTLTVIVQANLHPEQVHAPEALVVQASAKNAPGANVDVVLQMQTTAVTPGRALAKISLAGPARSASIKEEKRFEVAWNPPVWGWTRARQLKPEADLDSAFKYLVRLRDILVRRDPRAFAKLLSLKFREVATDAYGEPSAPLETAIVQGLSSCMNDPKWILMPCDRAELNLRVVGNSRLVECLRSDGGHALTYEKRGTRERFFIPIMLGELDSTWQVLR